MHFSLKLLRGLLWSIWSIYFAAALALLGMRYFVLPRIDEWRPQIERYTSEAIGARVQIGHIAADWYGLNPRLNLRDVQIYDGDSQQVLGLPAVEAVVAWRSVFDRTPRMVSLRAEGLDLTLRRDNANRLWVAGQAVDLNRDTQMPADHPGLRWLSRQREIALRHVTVRWIDELRGTPELVLSDASVVSLNGLLSHRFAVRANLPAALARSVEVRGEIDRSLFVRNGRDPANWHGQVYAEISDADPGAWSPWLKLPPVNGRLAARAWLQLDGTHLGAVTADVVARGPGWQWQDGTQVSAATLRVRLEGHLGDVLPQGSDLPFSRSAALVGVSLRGQASGIKAELPDVLQSPHLAFDSLQIDATARRSLDDTLAMDMRNVRVVNGDLDLAFQGNWKAQGKTDAGSADVRGKLARASMNAIHRYLPLSVTADARDWMARGLQAGVVQDASIVLKGDLDDFPFTAPGNTGKLHIGGGFTGATVDYAPAHGTQKGWPAIVGMDGTFSIDGASLVAEGLPGSVLRPADPQIPPIMLRGVRASIPNMEHHAELSVQGETAGPAQTYLAIAATSPLGGMLDNLLNDARGSGDWRMAMALQVPLLHLDDAKVDGTLVFNNNDFSMFPQVPGMEQLRGMLEFSEKDVRARDLQGQFMGGPVKINGSLLDNRNGLRFEGVVAAAALPQVMRAKAMSRFSGRTAYRGRLLYHKGGAIDVTLESDLVGMAVDMPAPAGKDAASSLPLKVQWSPAQDAGPKNRVWLTGSLGQNINLLLEHDPADGRAYFVRGALGANQPASLPQRGLSLKVTLPDLDADAWQTAVDAFSATPVPVSANSRARKPVPPLLPPVDLVAVNTPRLRLGGIALNDVTLYAERPAAAQWRVDIQSRQAAGSMSWREASGAIAGQVTGRFKYLSFGGEGDANKVADMPSDDELSDIPAVDLQADTLRLYGQDVGSLQVTGTNVERGRRWRLDKLRIANDDATLDATGFWRLSGADRGLTVDASAKFVDFGKLLARLGHPNTVAGGAGSVKGQMTWKDLPWSHDFTALDGTVEFSLGNGRFVHVTSRTARLLELLSLQSVQRLARLDFNPINLLREGFPFDTIHGHMKVSKGVIHTDDYKVSGPVATITLAGSTSIIDETWKLKATVIPNLDASGAAVATALVNPLLGLGAFLTQWALKHPLARAMTSEYAVTGSWNDPKVAPIEASPPRGSGPDAAAQAREFIEH